VLIGQPKACALAVRNVRAMRRLTNLAARLRQHRPGVRLCALRSLPFPPVVDE
jgi:hypothetical protein